jgi:hypothetical protein
MGGKHGYAIRGFKETYYEYVMKQFGSVFLAEIRKGTIRQDSRV